MAHRHAPHAGAPAWIAMLVPLAWLVAAPALPAARGQVSATESARKVKPADGLEATLWASEPMVVNPTNIDVDSRGRVWVAEGLNYRLTHSKQFPKVEDADKIKILEDTDGDGKADKVTVFADRIFPIPMGLAVEEQYSPSGKYLGCRVYIGNSPNLVVLEDTDGDDHADRRSTLLTGFGGIDSDHGVHGMFLGIDGKLYFTQGDGCCSFDEKTLTHGTRNFDVTDRSGRHISSDQLANTLRSNRDGTQFEVIADRQRNNYETCLDAFGHVFTSDNDDDGNRGCRVLWMMDGGKYGYHTPGSPRHWGEDVPGNVPKLVGTGNGSPCGLMVYEGNLLPKPYFGGILEADAGSRQINFFPLTRQGAAFRTEYKVLLASDDPWFRPVDVAAAPDGSVFVADWYDGGVGGHAFRDQTTGRIYRVTPKGVKPKGVKPDFASVPGAIEALNSPTVATQDAARRWLLQHAKLDRDSVLKPLRARIDSGTVHERARALWVVQALVQPAELADFLADKDPQIRELAVRILGRDESTNGHVESTNPDAKQSPPAARVLRLLLPLADDPDPGVRRELILALRNLPTEQVGDALRKLTRSWDGRDRWYLEALGLALEKRESSYIASLFDGSLFGDLDLDHAGKEGHVALPPYFPVDRNEAFIPVGAVELPASPLSKTLGLAWRLHRAEVLPLLGSVLSKLEAPELQQAADDVFAQMRDAKTAVVLAGLAAKATDPARKRQLLATLGRKLDTAWRDAQKSPEIAAVVSASLTDPALQLEAVTLAAATDDPRHASALLALARDPKAAVEPREAAVEALARLKTPEARTFVNQEVDAARGKTPAPATAVAAVRSLPRLGDARARLAAIVQDGAFSLGMRREALRTLARQADGSSRLLAIAREGKLDERLRTEAATLLNSSPDRSVRTAAAGVLPLPKTRGGKPLPPFFELVRREGNAARGAEVFFREGQNTCGGCHRVQGRGNWVGPDLSTIGTKYGRDELLRSILTPSAAIGANFRSLVVALDDGRVLSGLPVEDSADRLVLKTADGQRIAVRPAQVEERKLSDVSLMPEGLAETLTDTELVDLLAFLSTLKQPVSIVGQYHVIGPLTAKDADALIASPVDTSVPFRTAAGASRSWRRLNASAESLVDLSEALGSNPDECAVLHVPVVSPVAQQARLVIDTKATVTAYLNRIGLPRPPSGQGSTLTAVIDLPAGRTDLLLRVSGKPGASTVVTTVVSEKPVGFQVGDTARASR